MLKVTGHRLIVKIEVETQTESGIILSINERNERAHSVVGTVVDIGETAWQDFKCLPWCQKGDRIVFAKYAGRQVVDPDNPENEFVILNDEDVLCVVS
jgi:co-chaperonin GroES (HSP10)